ncbi:MAG: SDR family NAD(P)-dependent oxidoreductase [Acidimicrobiales bacterium]|jgi:NAD(P)-dependent dehydrogenase (short-subunit alcohol dehydrogenase family)
MTVVITGAATGIGAATARAFAGAGRRVAVTDLDIDAAQKTASTIDGALAFELDVRERKSIETACANAVDSLGPLEVWVSCAGVSSMGRFIDLTDEEIDLNLDVNIRGALVCGQVAARRLIEQGGGGCIINVASMAGKRGGVPYLAHYVASKFAVVGLTQAMAAELAPFHIRVNSVCPGYVRTGMQEREIAWEAELKGISKDEVVEFYLADTPLHRLQSSEEVASLALFLASDSAASITGESVAINGGSYMD